MLTQGESVEAHALRRRGWSVSAIARHLDKDRKTIRAYLNGEREPGRRKPAGPDRFAPFESYCRIRFGDDPHLWATALFDEVSDLGYDGSYPSFTRALRARGLRPGCEACAAAGTPEEFAVISHPAGGETQWDWVELPDPPPSFAEAAKHYGVAVDVCPSRRGWRKGVVEKANHSAAQRWWRTLPDDGTPVQAQGRLDAWCAKHGDARTRARDGARVTVGELAAAEPLAPLPRVPFPAVIEDTRAVSAQALVSWHGNRYSVPPGHGGQQVTVRHQLGAVTLDVVTAAGTVLARHRREPDHAGAVVRDEGHVAALEKKVLAARGQAAGPCHRKERRPPSAAALAGAAVIRGQAGAPGAPAADFAAWAAGARPLR